MPSGRDFDNPGNPGFAKVCTTARSVRGSYRVRLDAAGWHWMAGASGQVTAPEDHFGLSPAGAVRTWCQVRSVLATRGAPGAGPSAALPPGNPAAVAGDPDDWSV